MTHYANFVRSTVSYRLPHFRCGHAGTHGTGLRYGVLVGFRLTWSLNSSRYSTQQFVLWPHHWCTHRPSLVADTRAHTVHAGCSGVQLTRSYMEARHLTSVHSSVADLAGRRARYSAGSNHLVSQSNCPQSAVEPSWSPLSNSGTACLMTSFLLIRCRPFSVNSNIICSSSPVPNPDTVELLHLLLHLRPGLRHFSFLRHNPYCSTRLCTMARYKCIDWLIDWLNSLLSSSHSRSICISEINSLSSSSHSRSICISEINSLPSSSHSMSICISEINSSPSSSHIRSSCISEINSSLSSSHFL